MIASKHMIKVLLCIVMLLLITASLACSAEPANADEITKNLLQAVNDGDYTTYMGYFAEDIRWGLGSEQDFYVEVAAIKDQLGEYEANSLKYRKTEKENSLISVFYKAKFTKDPEVTVKSAFREVLGKTQMVGSWLNP